MLLKEITSFLEEKAHLSLQESYDNSGLIVGNPNMEISKALICLDCTEAVVDEAIEKGANLIIAHHPIVFKGLKTFTGKNYVERVVINAIKNNIAIYAIHTNLDNVKQGVNHKIAQLIGLTKTRVLAPSKGQITKLATYVPKDYIESVSNALFKAGAGSIGNYDQCSFRTDGIGTFRGNEHATPFVGNIGNLHREPEIKLEVILESFKTTKVLAALRNAHPYEEVAYDLFSLENQHQEIGAGLIGETMAAMTIDQFAKFVKEKMQVKVMRITKPIERLVKKVALCGGSGSFLLAHAKAAGADVFISADFKYHEFFDAENSLTIMDIGHYESEQFTIDLILDWLREKFPTFALLKTEVNTNPVNYV